MTTGLLTRLQPKRTFFFVADLNYALESAVKTKTTLHRKWLQAGFSLFARGVRDE